MTPITIQAAHLLPQLAVPAARALALAIAAGIALAAFRVRSAALQLRTWTAVLYAALVMPLLVWLLPPLPIPIPTFLPASILQPDSSASLQSDSSSDSLPGRETESAPQTARFTAHTEVAAATMQGVTESSAQLSTAPAIPSSPKHFPLPYRETLAAIYVCGALILLVRFFIGLSLNRRLLRNATPVNDSRLTLRPLEHTSPDFAESPFISVPLTLGVIRPTILLPTAWHAWDANKVDAVIAHEISHIARRDALTQRLSLLHRAIFWFSPLAWWLDRRLADLAEQASDEAVLSCGADRKQYARILLEFFEALHATPGRVRWIGVSMAKAGQAEQRVERILSWKGSVTMHLKKSIAIAFAVCAVPVVYVAASAFPAQHLPFTPPAAQTQDVSPAPQAASAPRVYPDAPAAPQAAPVIEPDSQSAMVPPRAVITDGVPGGISVGVVAPVAGVPPIPPIGSLITQDHSHSYSSHSSGHGYSYAYGEDDDGPRFVIVTGNSDSLAMSGSTEDAHHVQKLRKSISGDFIWFERDEKSYIIRDQATVARARAFWAPQEELGKKQEALGKQQEELGKQQEALGKKMEQIQIKVPDMTAELDKLKAKLQKLGPTASMEQLGDLQSEIGDLQSKIGDIQSQAGDQQGKVGEEMGALGEKQGKLGEEQGKLGEEQGRLAEEASKQMRQLLDEAITKGTAQPEL